MPEEAAKANGEVAANGGEAVPETFGTKVGIIVPPPDIKVIVDRTAQFIARLGLPFEREIIARNGKNKQFQFLFPENHYNAYYKDMIRQMQTGEAQKKKEEEEKKKKELAEQEAVKRAEEEKRKEEEAKRTRTLKEKLYLQLASLKIAEKEAEAPPPNVYSVRTPSIVFPVDVDIIKLTAQFVARNGRQFLAGLTAREQRNPQFEFLNPAHPLFTYFQKLVDAYAKVVIPPTKLLDELRKKIADPFSIYKETLVRSKHEAKKRDEEAKEAGDRDAEETMMAAIDWHDFVVVETINFNSEDDEYLPPPCKDYDEMLQALNAPAGGPPPPPGPGPTGTGSGGGGGGDGDMDVDMEVDDKPAPAPVAPRPAVERSLKAAAETRSTQYVKSPITGQLIHVDEMEEHMRIALLDPKWKEKKEALEQKLKERVNEQESDISRNLAMMAKRRPDVFVTEGDMFADDGNIDDDSILFQQKTRIKTATDSNAKPSNSAPPSRPSAPSQPHQSFQQQNMISRAPSGPGAQLSKPPMPAPGRLGDNKMPGQPNMPMPGMPFQRGMPGGRMPPGMPPGMPGMPPFGRGMPPGMPQFGRPPMPGMPPFGRPPMPGMPGMPPGQPPMPGRPPMPGQQPPRPGQQPPMPRQQPPMPGQQPPMPNMPPHQAPPPTGMPPQKKQRVEAPVPSILPEVDFIKQNPGALTIKVVIPLDEKRAQWKFNGQVLEVILPGVADKVSALKEKLKPMLNEMPPQKMRLRVSNGGAFLKDQQSFASLNLKSGTIIDLGVKERGRRKR